MTTSVPPPQNQPPRPQVSLFFPVYNDERTVRGVTEKSAAFLKNVASDYEIVIIDDGSPDRSGAIADDLAREYPFVRVVHHGTNRGYGEAIKTGFAQCNFEWICFTDGDGEYDVFDFYKLMKLRDYYDLIITFRYVRLYSGFRIFISRVYNSLVRLLFRTRYRDISTGLRMVRKSVARQVDLHSSSPFIGAELAIKLMLMGYRVGEVGIQTFPREFGHGASVSFPNIIATIRDMYRTYHTIFSKTYNLPQGRAR
jgi:glycosyltransferase involved in cell wall biosynthesis